VKKILGQERSYEDSDLGLALDFFTKEDTEKYK